MSQTESETSNEVEPTMKYASMASRYWATYLPRRLETIPVGQRQGKYDAVTLVVLDSDLQMDEVTIVMGNKERYTPKLKHAFKEGQRTQAIPLPHGNRFIDHVELTYSNLPGGGNARVEVWGKPAKAPK